MEQACPDRLRSRAAPAPVPAILALTLVGWALPASAQQAAPASSDIGTVTATGSGASLTAAPALSRSFSGIGTPRPLRMLTELARFMALDVGCAVWGSGVSRPSCVECETEKTEVVGLAAFDHRVLPIIRNVRPCSRTGSSGDTWQIESSCASDRGAAVRRAR